MLTAYRVHEQLHSEGRLATFPATLTYLRLPPPGSQQIDGRFFSFPSNLLGLHNYCWTASHPLLPSSLRILSALGWDASVDTRTLRFPPSLTSLSFFRSLGVCGLSMPSLRGCPMLTDVGLQGCFDRPLLPLQLPASVTRLCGVCASQIQDWTALEGVLELHVLAYSGDVTAPAAAAKWPPRLRVLRLPHFSTDLSGLTLPESLTTIDFTFQPGMEHVRWPASLRKMTCTSSSEHGGFVPLQWNDGLEVLWIRQRDEPDRVPFVDWIHRTHSRS
jgi:hypothetical protein